MDSRDDLERRRVFYTAKIKELDDQAAKATDPDAIESLNRVANGYRALLRILKYTQH